MSRPPVYPFSGGASNAPASSSSSSFSGHTGYAPFQTNDSTQRLPNSALSSSASLVDHHHQQQYGVPRSPMHGSLNPSSALASSSSFPSSSKLHRRTPSVASYNSGNTHSLSEKFSLSPDPSFWAHPSVSQIEPDDYLHNPDPKRDHKNDRGGTIFTARGLANIGCLAFLVIGLTTLFAGYPLITFVTKPQAETFGAFGIGGTNSSGQVPQIPGNWSVIDKDTPAEAYTKTSFQGVEMELVFSDEFNLDGRSFYPGDDPYWEAADLHYWQTNDLEWYDPNAVTTKDGKLVITLSNTPEHNLNYTSGMISSWNKFCFTGGRIEVSVMLPGSNSVPGLWPAVWTMGNLGRAGYGASLEGMWPYSYDSCDVGTLPNQTLNGQPHAATINGDPTEGGVLSFLQGQRLSACTCKGEAHPGPIKPDGTYTGRAAPEIDVLEAQVDPITDIGTVSQSSQWAPFDASYIWDNSSQNLQIDNPSITQLNPYKGGVFQQATSGLSLTNQSCYELNGGCSTVYGYEYLPDRSKGYISWINNGVRSWTIQAAGMGPNELVNISQRIIPEEPMYIIMNLGLSENFGGVIDFAGIDFPVHMLVDWVRVYQPKGAKNIGCDPPDYPTQDYINTFIEAYSDVNLTTWTNDFGQTFPKNKLIDNCST